jgi:hypothetical protein
MTYYFNSIVSVAWFVSGPKKLLFGWTNPSIVVSFSKLHAQNTYVPSYLSLNRGAGGGREGFVVHLVSNRKALGVLSLGYP